MSTEAIRVILQSIEHNQLVYMLSYQYLSYEYAAIHYCAQYERSDVIALIVDCVSEEECNQLLSIVGRHSSIETIRDSVSNDTWKWYSEFHYLTTMIVSTFIETTIIELLV